MGTGNGKEQTKTWLSCGSETDQQMQDSTEHRRGPGSGVASFESLLSHYGGRVYWLAWHITADNQEAEDVLRQTFLKAHSHPALSHQSDLSYAWLARITVKESLAKLRDRAPGRLLLVGGEVEANEAPLPRKVVDWGELPEQRYANDELQRIVHGAIQGLTPASRLVLVLHDMAGLRSEETAHLLDLSVPQTKSWLLRGRLQLREHLNEYFKLPFNQGTQIG